MVWLLEGEPLITFFLFCFEKEVISLSFTPQVTRISNFFSRFPHNLTIRFAWIKMPSLIATPEHRSIRTVLSWSVVIMTERMSLVLSIRKTR